MPAVTAAERGVIVALYPGLANALDAAGLLLDCRRRLHQAERRHCEQNGSKRTYDTAVAKENQAAAALTKALHDWNEGKL
jgi:hypothetical protein